MPRWLERALPHFDIEGEAVEREIALAGWPEPRSTAVVAADDLGVVDGDRVLYTGVTMRMEPGDTLVVTGDDPRASRALLLTIAGRLAPTDGIVKVAGHLLPGRGAWVRRHVGVALLFGSADPLAELRRALRGSALVVVDGLDAVPPGSARDQAAALLRDAAAAATIVVAAADAAMARRILVEAGRMPIIDLDLRIRIPASPDADTAEVTA